MSEMPAITEIAFVCYVAKDIKRAQNFYGKILGLRSTHFVESPEGIWQEYDIGSGTLAIGQMPGWEPGPQGGTAALEVADFDKAIEHLNAHSVKLLMGPIETPVCRMAIIEDSEGNSVLIHKRKAGHH